MSQDIKEELASLDIGSKIRNLRTKREMTLQDLATLTGLSKPNLSQIENNLVSPPIATLLKISSALGVVIGHFFQDSPQETDIVVVRKDKRHGIAKGKHISHIGYQYHPLAYPKINKAMEPFVVHMEEREPGDIAFNNHRGEEFLYKVVTLEEGDCIYFDSVVPHGYRGVGGTAKALAIIHRPN